MKRLMSGCLIASSSLSLAALLAYSPASVLAANQADRCEAGKLKVAGQYGSCRLREESKTVKKGGPSDFARCQEKFTRKWEKTEGKGAGLCPTEEDRGAMDERITLDTTEIATLLAGGTLPVCGDASVDPGEQCDGADLAGADCTTLGFTGGTLTCDSSCFYDLSGCTAGGGGLVPGIDPILPSTGQTTCHDTTGSVIACAGTGHDGDVQAGQVRSFTNNGDGTITDNATGLMWEIKCDGASCGALHDKDTTYTWNQAFTWHVATLNSTGFAGHNDWRVPNFLELQTLWDMEKGPDSAPTTFVEFDSCQADCDVTSCSCTKATLYWSSTTFMVNALGAAWAVNFTNGDVGGDNTLVARNVRAVRGGL